MYLPQPQAVDPFTAEGATRQTVLAARAELDEVGRLVVRFAGRDRGYLVRRMVVQGVAGTAARVYAGEPDPLNLADGTNAGAADVADYAQPLYVPEGLPLVVVWANSDGTTPADPDGLTTARIEIQDV